MGFTFPERVDDLPHKKQGKFYEVTLIIFNKRGVGTNLKRLS